MVNSEKIAGRVPAFVLQAVTLIAQVSLLWAASFVGHEVVELAHLPLPGCVAGLLVMFAALSSGVIPLRFVEQGADLLVRNLPLFFVPLAVGFVTQGRLLATHGVPIFVALVASAALGFAVTGRIAQCVIERQGKSAPTTWRTHAAARLGHR